MEATMGRTEIQATVQGPNGTRRFTFLVDTGSTFLGLPMSDIEALGLPMIVGSRHRVMTAAAIIEEDSFSGAVRIGDEQMPAIVTEAPIPLIGYEILENMKFRVNPVSQELERVSDDKASPPFRLQKTLQTSI